jgi:tetratricopeptide (TPR) repeat protein
LRIKDRLSLTEAGVFLLYLGFVLPLITLGTEDIRLAGVFSLDEAGIATEVSRMYEIGMLELPSFKYGGIFYYVPLLFLNVWSLFGEVTEGLILIAVRSFGAVSGAGCLWMTWRLGNLVFNRASGWIASFLLLLTPVFLRWSIESHPDLQQLFFMLCGLYYALLLCGKYETRAMVLSSVFAGLAFGTKYSGVFLLPVIVLSVLLPEDGMLRPGAVLRRLKTTQIWWVLLMIPAVFCVTVAVTNPYMILEFEAFRKSLLMEKGIMGFGHSFRVDTGGVVWLEMLWGLLGKVHGTVLLVTLLFWMWYLVKGKFGIPASKGMLVLWMAMFVVYLMLEVNLRRPRHLLPVLPCGLLVVGYAYTEILGKLRRRVNAGWVWAIPVLLLLSWDHVSSSTRLFGDRWVRVGENEELAVGRWLAANYPAETTILYDAYSYVPGVFDDAVPTALGLNHVMVNHLEPDLLVVRQAASNDFVNLEDAGNSRVGRDSFLDSHYFYEYLKSGHVHAYGLVMDFGRIAVYQRRVPLQRSFEGTGARWMDRVKQYADGRAYGVSETRRAMARVHASLGEREQADRENKLADEAENYAVSVYAKASEHLRAGRLEDGKSGFNTILGMIASKPAQYRGSIRHDMARQYFEGGFYEEATAEVRKAIILNPQLRDAHFDLGIFYLVLGRIPLADQSFAEAVKLFGKDRGAIERIEAMIDQDVKVKESRQILSDHFGMVSP